MLIDCAERLVALLFSILKKTFGSKESVVMMQKCCSSQSPLSFIRVQATRVKTVIVPAWSVGDPVRPTAQCVLLRLF